MRHAPHAGKESSELAATVSPPRSSIGPTLVVDFDGTITLRDTLELVVEEFGDPAVRRQTETELGRSLSFEQVIADQYATVRSPLPVVVEWALENVKFRPGFNELIQLARERGWEVTVVSSGILDLIEPLLAREGVEGLTVIANSVDPDPSGWRVRFREREPCEVCGEQCKRRAVQALSGGRAVIYLGDGYSDGCAAEAAEMVFARRRLTSYLQERGRSFEAFEDFFEVARKLSEMSPEGPAEDERALERERARAEARAMRLETEARVWRERAERAEARLEHWQAWERRASWHVFLRLMALRTRVAPPGSLRDRAVRRGARGVAGRGRQQGTESEPRPRRPKAAKAVLIVSGRPGATKRYRCDHRAEQLRALGASVDVAMLDELDLSEILDDYACFVLHRVPFDASVGVFLDAAKARGTPVVFDTDDLLFDASAEPFLPEPARQDDGVARQRQTLTTCDAATVTTAPLGERAARLQERVLVEPNVVSEEMIRHANAALDLKVDGESPDRMLTIAYLSGTPTHDADFLEAADGVLWALETHPSARFLGVGRLTVDSRFERFADRVELVGMQPWELLPDVLAAVDVNLAPLEGANPFSECKSCLKYLEAGLLGVPTIASPRPDFERVIEHGRNGLLADTPSEWRSALGDLLESPERRHEIGRAAFEDVRRNHTTGAQSIHARETLRSVARPRAAAAPLTINWLVEDAALRPLAQSLAARDHVVRHYETDSRPETIRPADVSIADRTTAGLVAAHERSLFKCVYLSEPFPAPAPGFLAICTSSELARDLAESTGRPAEHLDLGKAPLRDSTAWDGLAGNLADILRRTCFVSLRPWHRRDA